MQTLRIWLNRIAEQIRMHRPDLIFKGNNCISQISKANFEPDTSTINFHFTSVVAKSQIASIAYERAFETSLYLHSTCSCPNSGTRFHCEHTFAALTVLHREFTIPDSKIVVAVLGEPEPSWTIALRTLDQFINQKSVPDEPVDGPAKSRLAWRLSVYGSMNFNLDPVEQTPGKRGGWNKGRALNWDRVRLHPQAQLLPQDHEVLRSMGDSRHYYSGPTTNQIGAILEKLIGHPYVFFHNIPMNVVRGQLGLLLEESDKDWKLVPAIDGRSLRKFSHFTSGDTVCGFACDSEQGKIFVVRANYELWRMAISLLEEAPTIPPEVQSEFLKRLPALEAKLPVGLPGSLKGEFVPAEQRLVVRLTPINPAGATIQIQVQPAPNGAYYLPGEGPKEIAGQIDQVRVQVSRDHFDERQRADSLAKELFLQRFQNVEPFKWSMPSDDDVLDMLDVLRARPENDPVVLWPEAKEARKMQVLGEVSPSGLRVEVKDQHDWFGLTGTIEIGGQSFPLTTLLTAIKGGRRYLDLGKGQFAAISQEFRNRLASVTDMIHSNRGKLEFNATAAPVLADLSKDEVTLKASKKWKQSLKRLQLATDLDPVVPSTLTADLRDYQVEGYKWLRRLAEWGVGGCLADDMGLGKTVQAIAVLLDRREIGPTLIVAPVSVGFNWMREVERFAPTLRPILYRDTDRVEFLKTLGNGDLLITSYHLLQQHAAELSGIKWGTLVLDEAQAIKNSQTKTSQAVREIEADWRLALTGTPAENHLGDLWSLFRGVAPGLFGSWERFREVFADPIEKGKDVVRKQALSRVIRPFILRRTKSEVLTELPARTEIQLTAELSKEERRVYEDARLWAVTNLTDMIDGTDKDQRFQVLAALTKLRQLACHPRLVDKEWKLSSAKLDLFLETIDELREGRHRALVFSQFTQHLALIREA
ncbi:MAG: SNF2-related protein, partial [Schlesneria sp.]